MRIVRFQSSGRLHYGQQVDEHVALRIDGDVFGPHRITDQKLRIDKLLAPSFRWTSSASA